MKIWKIAKRVIKYALLILIVVMAYFRMADTPVYEGRFTVDINNTTSQYIEGAVIEYVTVGESVTLPTVKPYERLIVVMPKGIGKKPMITPILLNYKGRSREILDEFYVLNGDKYNADVGQLAKAKIVNGDIEYLYPYDLFDMHIKPYFRIIDMDKE